MYFKTSQLSNPIVGYFNALSRQKGHRSFEASGVCLCLCVWGGGFMTFQILCQHYKAPVDLYNDVVFTLGLVRRFGQPHHGTSC